MVSWGLSPQVLWVFSSWHTVVVNEEAAVHCSQSPSSPFATFLLSQGLCFPPSGWLALGHKPSLSCPWGLSLPAHLSCFLHKTSECPGKPQCAHFAFFRMQKWLGATWPGSTAKLQASAYPVHSLLWKWMYQERSAWVWPRASCKMLTTSFLVHQNLSGFLSLLWLSCVWPEKGLGRALKAVSSFLSWLFPREEGKLLSPR